MKSTKESLWDYITCILNENRTDDVSNLYFIIKKFSLQTILLDKLCLIDKEKYYKINALLLQQKKQNAIIKEQMTHIINAFNEKGIRFIPFKGVFLANDLYDPPETRLFTDIDVLINFRDIETILGILTDLGFMYINNYDDYKIIPISSTHIMKPNLENEVHLEFVKKIFEDKKEHNVHLELHINLIEPFFMTIDYNQLFARAKYVNLWGQNVLSFETNDQLIQLFLHFIKHLSFEVFFMLIWGKGISPQIKILHDIALFIDKYQDAIDWETVIERLRNYRACSKFVFVANIVDKIYPHRIPSYFIERLLAPAESEIGIVNYYYRELYKLESREIFCGNLPDFFHEILGKKSHPRQKIMCPFESHTKDDTSTFTVNNCIEKNSKPDCRGIGRTWWDRSFFYMQIRVFDDVLVFESSQDIYPRNHDRQDGIELYFNTIGLLKEPPFLRYFLVLPTYNNNKPELRLKYSALQYAEISTEYYQYDCRIYEDGYEITLGVKWDTLKIEPHSGDRIGFNIIITDCDKKSEGLKTRLSLSPIEYETWDVTTFSELMLT